MSNNASPIFNQLGFTPKSQKTVVFTECGPWDLNVYDENGEKVLTASPSKAGEWEYSGETVQSYDLTTLNKPGQYYLIRNNKRFDLPLTISIDVYHGLAKSSLKWFYYQRASMELEKKYAGKWARAAGHSDIHVKVYDDPNRFISAPKGWYDAGDYGKYIVNSAISVFTLLQLEEHFPEYVKNLKWNIPEDEQIQNLPDLLSEVKYNLDWMLAMQESDGGVFHKLSTLKFCPHYAPAQDTADRYVIGKTTSATLDFAGNMAQASILFSKYDSEYADRMLEAAKKAWRWAKKNPRTFFKQPHDVNTGLYVPPNEDAKSNFRFAATELFRATGNDEYAQELQENPLTTDIPWWGNLNFLAIYHIALNEKYSQSGLLHSFDSSLVQKATKILLNEADSLCKISKNSIYKVAMRPEDWTWGSNGVAANNGIILLHAYYLTQKRDYLDAAQQILDYLLGKNPLQICYVTGFGHKSPMHPHHRPSEGDCVVEPIPGMLAGGPHLGAQDVHRGLWVHEDYTASRKPALAYMDHEDSFATNEVAINWNAPLAYLAAALNALYRGI